MTSRVGLVVEDGTEYVTAFRRLAPPDRGVELLHAPNAAAAREILAARRVGALFLDVVFDRTPPEHLVGDLDQLIRRLGDRATALDRLARDQGFYVLTEIAPLIAPGTPVLLAHDFSSQPERLAALRVNVPGLEGVAESTTITQILERLLRG